MGGTLAAWGRRPGSTEQVLPAPVVTEVLTIESTDGVVYGTLVDLRIGERGWSVTTIRGQ